MVCSGIEGEEGEDGGGLAKRVQMAREEVDKGKGIDVRAGLTR